jgi:SAM-dependent methyltransferase
MEIRNQNQSYRGIVADLYDVLFNVSPEEYNFYLHFMHRLPGKALELACGTGQFLLPYLEEGLPVEGADASDRMLEICKEKAHPLSLEPILYQQAMESLDLPYQYTTLYVPSCSFMLITDYQLTQQALNRFYSHLTPGGQLLISLFIPLQEYDQQANTEKLRRIIYEEENRGSLYYYERLGYNFIEQLRTGIWRFEKYDSQDSLLKTELYTLTWRWYGRYEFERLLTLSGFENVSTYGDFTLDPPTENAKELIFRAEKPSQK